MATKSTDRELIHLQTRVENEIGESTFAEVAINPDRILYIQNQGSDGCLVAFSVGNIIRSTDDFEDVVESWETAKR